ncbi:hypothetical protein ACGF5M_03125 [Gemmatimonadota bacterium]
MKKRLEEHVTGLALSAALICGVFWGLTALDLREADRRFRGFCEAYVEMTVWGGEPRNLADKPMLEYNGDPDLVRAAQARSYLEGECSGY